MATFQSTVNIYAAAALQGDVAFDSPSRVISYNINSSGTPNTVGYAYTITNGGSPDTALGSPLAGTVQVGGSTGVFAGILCNPRQYALYGTNNIPLNPTLNLPDNSVGSLLTMGKIWVYIDNLPQVGDLVTYNPATGALSSIPSVVSFTASIAAGGASTADVMTVSAVSRGQLQVGAVITGAGVVSGVGAPVTIASLGTGKGYTGTYNLSTINTLTVSSEAMTATSKPAPAFSGTATCSGTTMTVASVVSGQVYVGMAVNAASGFPAGTVVTAYGSGVGGTGTYTINTSQTVTPAVAITDTANILIPNAVVTTFDVTVPGLTAIQLTN